MTRQKEPVRKEGNPPAHVAFVMDGNGRWATSRGLPRLAGHREGIANVEKIAIALKKRGVRYMTIYMFSTENWKRPKEEVDGIFDLLVEWFRDTVPCLMAQGVSIRHYGKPDRLPSGLAEALHEAAATSRGDDFVLGLAIDYGGRAEIVDAIRSVVSASHGGEHIDESAIADALYTSGVPDPDLIVRPGGELRLSNYMLWQAAYAELYFIPVLWPDFDELELDRALKAFDERHRRFGGL
ncbi:MAG: di-trans,poly-cis-decaprenylcistransferase [Dehalococcoidia bacterium]|nr:di-trans,poly-cis-decaprenylcistransferase [Dehalococcoidia bacterium]